MCDYDYTESDIMGVRVSAQAAPDSPTGHVRDLRNKPPEPYLPGQEETAVSEPRNRDRQPLTALEWLRVTHADTLSGRRIEEALTDELEALIVGITAARDACPNKVRARGYDGALYVLKSRLAALRGQDGNTTASG